jgi:hypothetical protein
LYRKPSPPDDVLEKLIEERDHKRIQIHLAPEGTDLKALNMELRELESMIHARQRGRAKTAIG